MVPARSSREVVERSRRLWIAVLHQAIEDARGRSVEVVGESVTGIQREALTWIFDEHSNAANSFSAICELLDIDPQWARLRFCRLPGIRRGLVSAQGDMNVGEG